MTDHHIERFVSPTYGNKDLPGVVEQIKKFIEAEDNSHFQIVVGTDSALLSASVARFVSAVIVHHVGHGGIYFWGTVVRDGIKDLRQRMYEEATYSLTLAQLLLEEFRVKDLPLEKILEIHVDVGENGDTRTMITEIVGMIKGSGFECKTKPNSFAASNVADRHT